MKILLLVRSLGVGGTERQTVELAKGLHARGHSVTVATFYAGGEFTEGLRVSGVPVRSLDKKGRYDIVPFMLRLVRMIREVKPEVLYTMMPAENLAGLVAKLRFPSLRLVWGVRSSLLDFAHYDLFSRLVYRVEALLSRFPDLVIANSRAGAELVISKGFPREKVRVVWNGIDCNRFAPDRSAGEQVRRRWGVRNGRLLIGMVGRLDPMKDHSAFLRAAKTLARTRDVFEFVCVGGGPPSSTDPLSSLDRELQEQGKLHWIPFESNMPAVYNALNLLVLCSAFGEGFPNVVGEAMACGIPCVVTDVGDCATLVADTGWIVPSRDPEALATAVGRALQEMQQRDVGAAARERALAEFGLGRLLAETERVLSPLVGNHESH